MNLSMKLLKSTSFGLNDNCSADNKRMSLSPNTDVKVQGDVLGVHTKVLANHSSSCIHLTLKTSTDYIKINIRYYIFTETN